MHGCKQTLQPFLKPTCGGVSPYELPYELPAAENMSLWAGLLYRRLANTDPGKHANTATGDETTVDANGLQSLVQQLLPLVQSRKTQAAGAAQSSGSDAGSVKAEI
jgi:hypothetical protein